MRRIIAGFLAIIMLCSCLSGCSVQLPDFLKNLLPQETEPPKSTEGSGISSGIGSFFDDLFQKEEPSIADQPKEAVDPLVISDTLRDALNTSVIFSPGSAWVYAQGVRSMLEGALPIYVEDILMVPALALAQLLGAQCSQNGSDYIITLGSITLTLTPGSAQLRSGDSTVALPIEITPEKGDLLVSAPELCSALGQELAVKDDLVFIGEHVAAVETEESNGMELIGSALSSEFSCNDPDITALGAVSTGDGYFARAERSACLVLTADMIPYTSEDGVTIAVAGSLYVENLMVEPSASRDDYYSCSMTVYNTGYTYGSVESFDKDDNLIEFEKVKPFEGQKASVTKALTDLVVLGVDIYQAIDHGSLAELDYRSSLNASKSTITLEVPSDGYIFVTCNPMHSERVAVYNAVHTFFTLASLAQDIVKSKDSNAQEGLTDYIVKQIMANPNVASEIAMEFTSVLTSTSITPTDPAAYAQQVGEGILSLFARCEFDIEGVLQNTAKDLGTGALDKSAEGYLSKLLPAMNVAFTAWKISYAGSNTVCLFLDLAYCTKTRSVIIEIGDWRAAYAQLLRQRGNKGGEKSALAYINNDGIPELIVFYAYGHYDSYSEIYTYQKRQVFSILGTRGEIQLYTSCGLFEYAEFRSTLFWSDVNNGVVTESVTQIENNTLKRIYYFADTSVSGFGEHYYYNQEEVPKFYYQWKQRELEKEYGDDRILFDGCNVGWSINEENIREQLKR